MANESVLFKRGDSATITSTPVIDGQILFDTSGNGKMYLDNGTDRLEMGGAITVDASLSKTSTNAIQNKAVTGNILNSLTEVDAATQQNTIAGALALKEANSNFGGCSFEQEGNDFYIKGADSVRKKLGKTERHVIKSGVGNGSFSVAAQITGYDKLTTEDFAFVVTKATTSSSHRDSDYGGRVAYDPVATCSPTLSYDASSGTITITGCTGSKSQNGPANSVENRGVGLIGTVYFYGDM